MKRPIVEKSPIIYSGSKFNLMKIFYFFALLFLSTGHATGQNYLTVGFGFSGIKIHSGDLDQFKKTYNAVNRESLAIPLKGLGDALGIRLDAGYRSLSKIGYALNLGYQKYEKKDAARYGNYETRELELKLENYFVEAEMGKTMNNYYFVNGIFSLSLQRNLHILSTYRGQSDSAVNKGLDGNYSNGKNFSVNFGLAIGLIHKPVLLIGKIIYPFYTSGKQDVLRDSNPQKIAQKTDIFPNDYFDYVGTGGYQGIKSNIDGLKILVEVSFAIPLKKIS